MEKRKIELTYIDDPAKALTAETLAKYDGLVLYANIDRIEPEQEKALLDFVEGGKGFIPLHCASYCFRNSPKFVELVGAQFQRHGGEVFRVENAAPDHAIMKGYGGFESWDETYIHTRHNERDRTVLEYRARRPGGRAAKGALDLGPHARQGTSFLHGMGTRPADVRQSGISKPGRARHPLGMRAGPVGRSGTCVRRFGSRLAAAARMRRSSRWRCPRFRRTRRSLNM